MLKTLNILFQFISWLLILYVHTSLDKFCILLQKLLNLIFLVLRFHMQTTLVILINTNIFTKNSKVFENYLKLEYK